MVKEKKIKTLKLLLLFVCLLTISACNATTEKEGKTAITFETCEAVINGGSAVNSTFFLIPIESVDDFIDIVNVSEYFQTSCEKHIEIKSLQDENAEDYMRTFYNTTKKSIEEIVEDISNMYPMFKYEDLSKYHFVKKINAISNNFIMPTDSITLSGYKFLIDVNVIEDELVDPTTTEYTNMNLLVEFVPRYCDRSRDIVRLHNDVKRKDIIEFYINSIANDVNDFKDKPEYKEMLESINGLQGVENETERSYLLMKAINSINVKPVIDRYRRSVEVMITEGYGNCLEYASLYNALGEDLGLNVSMVSGYVGDLPHSWNIVWTKEYNEGVFIDSLHNMMEYTQGLKYDENGEIIEISGSEMFEREYRVFTGENDLSRPCDARVKEFLRTLK